MEMTSHKFLFTQCFWREVTEIRVSSMDCFMGLKNINFVTGTSQAIRSIPATCAYGIAKPRNSIVQKLTGNFEKPQLQVKKKSSIKA
ncbi:hypothetical protein J437_LFUL000984 [Ladona fulva]|uniref:Uncharacterized protein n=1 Tax=Ladona fulva TaxID=123851 RepID=A0A8K0KFU7_LADFU|nr:hypothetical protein J437_LFUL000984 [Ladona fulva]